MSNSDDEPGTQAQGGQPQGGQPQGGQPGSQPPAGQPGQGNPPAGGQPAGTPQGQYQGGQPPQGGYDTGPDIGDIFSIPETKNEMKIGVLLNVLLSIGLTFGALGLSTASTGFGTVGGSFAGAIGIGVSGGLVLAPIVGMYLGIRQADVLEDQPSNVTLGNAAVTTFAGTFVLMLLSLILGLIIGGAAGGIGNAIGTMLLPYIITALGAAVVAAGSGWAVENIVPGPSRTRARQQQGQPR